jgi:hypothetical protein
MVAYEYVVLPQFIVLAPRATRIASSSRMFCVVGRMPGTTADDGAAVPGVM